MFRFGLLLVGAMVDLLCLGYLLFGLWLLTSVLDLITCRLDAL